MQDIKPEDARALLASTQQLRTHWSGVITTHLGIAITVNFAIWAYFLKSYIDQTSTSTEGDLLYLYMAGALSSFFVGLWRVYARDIDDNIANLYPDFLLYEGILNAPLERSTGGYLNKAVPRIERVLIRDDISLHDKVEVISTLVSMRRIGDRGHLYIDLVMLLTVSVILAGGSYLMVEYGVNIKSLSVVLIVLGFGLILFAMLHFQKNPREKDIDIAMHQLVASEQKESNVSIN